MKDWIMVGFKHPDEKKSLIYKYCKNDTELLKEIKKGIKKGCNIFSIRGFEKEGNVTILPFIEC